MAQLSRADLHPNALDLLNKMEYKCKKKVAADKLRLEASDRLRLESYVDMLIRNVYSRLNVFLKVGDLKEKKIVVKYGRELKNLDFDEYTVVKPTAKMLEKSEEYNLGRIQVKYLNEKDYFIPSKTAVLENNSLFLLFPKNAVVGNQCICVDGEEGDQKERYWKDYSIPKSVIEGPSQLQENVHPIGSTAANTRDASSGKRKHSPECVSENVINQLPQNDLKTIELIHIIKKLNVPNISEDEFHNMTIEELPTKALFLCHYKGNTPDEDTVEYQEAKLTKTTNKKTKEDEVKYVFKDRSQWAKTGIKDFYQGLKSRNKDLANLPPIIPVAFKQENGPAKKSKAS